MMGKAIWVGFVSAIVLGLICAGVYAFIERSDPAQATLSQVDTIVGVDADPAGNTATSIATINSCISVDSTDVFYIDVFIQNVTNLNAFEGVFRFDGSLVEVTGVDVQYFLATDPESSVTDYSGSVPDNTGSFLASAFDYADDPFAPESGEGILARLEITALAPGISKANFDLRPDGYPISGVQLFDVNGDAIGDLDEDDYFDGDSLNAEIRVDEPCPGECLPGFDTDGDGFDDDVECYLPTDQDDDCSDEPGVHDAWPLDIDIDRSVSITGDVFAFVGRIGAQYGDPAFLTRLDLDKDSSISITGDVFLYVGRVGEICT